jgi:putative ABC transport system permease protein
VVALIGILILYQVVSAEIVNNLPEYATLRAMGYSDWRLIWIILQQTFLLLLASFSVGFVLALGLYWQISEWVRTEITMTTTRACTIAGCVLITGWLVSRLAARKLLSRDPADVF